MDIESEMFYIEDDYFSYSVNNGIAYTEENIAVDTIYFKANTQVSYSEVEKFRKFGKITDLFWMSDPLNNNCSIASVHFERAEDAFEALKSLKQVKSRPSTAVATIEEETAATLTLVDDCWIQICSLLDLRDQLMFALSCPHFKRIFLMSCKIKSFELSIIRKFTPWQSKELFKLIGNSLERLYLLEAYYTELYFKMLLPIFPHYATNLRILHLSKSLDWPRKTLQLELIVQHLQQLEELKLVNCGIIDDQILLLQQLPDLIKLDLSCNNKITGQYLDGLRKLQFLSLESCAKVEAINLIHCFTALKQLKTLILVGLNNLELKVVQTISEKCQPLQQSSLLNVDAENTSRATISLSPALKNLAIHSKVSDCNLSLLNVLNQSTIEQIEKLKVVHHSYCYICIEEVSKFKSLTHLNLSYINTTDLSKLYALANLEVLKLSCVLAEESNIDLELFRLLKNCTKMQSLFIEDSFNITKQFILNMIENRNEFMSQKRKINLIFGDSHLDDEILKESLLIENKNWLNAGFEECDVFETIFKI